VPVYLYWGEDDFAIEQAVEGLRTKVLDANWLQFNYHKLPGDRSETIIEGLNQIMTPVFGLGERLVWLVDTNICQSCPPDLLTELERTLEAIPANSHLLLTTSKKPDGRLKSTKLLQKYALIRDFSLISPFNDRELQDRVREIARHIGVKLNNQAVELLAESVGNNTRQLWSELTKLQLFLGDRDSIIDEKIVTELVACNTQKSWKLASTICTGKTDLALSSVKDLCDLNEPVLKIVATLVGQFRTYTLVKLVQETGERDPKKIAAMAEVNNHYRINYIIKEISGVSAAQLKQALPLLLDLEYSIKTGKEPVKTLQIKTIELCNLFNTVPSKS
jgi:DNA polymerase-3 subunit delta